MAMKEKKAKTIKCAKCDLEFPESVASDEHKNRAFVWDGKILCEDCLVMMGGSPGVAQSWWDFSKNQDKAKPHDW